MIALSDEQLAGVTLAWENRCIHVTGGNGQARHKDLDMQALAEESLKRGLLSVSLCMVEGGPGGVRKHVNGEASFMIGP